MISAARKFLGCSHIVVFGLGMILGLRGSLETKHEDSPPPCEAASSSSLTKLETEVGETTTVSKKLSTEDYSAAWDSLKGRFLPKQDRLQIAKALLQEWSVIDLEAAVRAVFAETTDEGPGQIGRVRVPSLLDLCAPGIKADPLKAWELVRSRASRWETVRLRRAWLDCMVEANPGMVISILGELPKRERIETLDELAESSCNAEDPAQRAAIWTQLSALPDTVADQEFITHAAETICYHTPPAELATRLLGETMPTGRKICISALSLSVFKVKEDEELSKLLLLLPPTIRGEVAATAITQGDRNEKRALFLANVALESGNLDALQAAAADPSFSSFAEGMKQPLALADWALRLPEDPRTLDIFRQSIEGAARRDSAGIRAKIHSLPPGWLREQGLAALAKVEKQRKSEEE